MREVRSRENTRVLLVKGQPAAGRARHTALCSLLLWMNAVRVGVRSCDCASALLLHVVCMCVFPACSLRVPSCVQRAYTKPGTRNPRWWCPFRGQHSVVGRVVVARRHTWSVATVVPCFRRANLLDQCFPTIFPIVSQLNAFKILTLHEHQVLESCYINRYVLRVKSGTSKARLSRFTSTNKKLWESI